MISVIICSVNPQYLKAVSENIETTIGVPYELIVTDNRNSRKGICKVYNEAAAKANNELLCFVHEDVRFHTTGWGEILKDLFKEEPVELVGVSGSVYKSKYPGTWAACSREFYRVNTLQHYGHIKEPVLSKCNPFLEKSSEVSV
ncbi:MAG: glycosyltransferase, partial [Ferruginibacter sp.]